MNNRFWMAILVAATFTGGIAAADDVAVRGRITVGDDVRINVSTGNRVRHGMSPYANTHHESGNYVYRHNYSNTHVYPAPGRAYAHWGNGFVAGGGDFHILPYPYPHRPHYPHDRPRHVHGRHCNWIDGYYEWREEQVYVPARYETKYVPAQYRTVEYHGQWVPIMVSPGRTEKVLVPAHYETRREKVWVPGRWSCDR